MMTTNDYAAAWRRKRLLRWSLVGLLFAALATRRLHRWGDSGLADALGAAVLTLLVVVLALIVLFRCPRCNEFFYWGRRSVKPFGRRCVHCQLQAQ